MNTIDSLQALKTAMEEGATPQPVAEFLAQLDDGERLALLEALGNGLLDARQAVQAVTHPDPRGTTIANVRVTLSRAIAELLRARALLANTPAQAQHSSVLYRTVVHTGADS